MKELRKVIVSELRTIHPRVYFMEAPKSASFPYLVYSLEITDLGDNLRLITLDVDGWDNNSDTTALENLMSFVKNQLNKNLVINENIYVLFYLDRQLALEDDNPELNRRKYIFLGRLYER